MGYNAHRNLSSVAFARPTIVKISWQKNLSSCNITLLLFTIATQEWLVIASKPDSQVYTDLYFAVCIHI